MSTQVELEYRLLLNHLSDGVIAADERGVIVYANTRTEELLGWPPGELVGRLLEVIQPRQLRTQHEAGFTRYLTTRTPVVLGHALRVPALRKDGEEIDVDLTIERIETEGEELFVAVLRPATDGVTLTQHLDALAELRGAAAAGEALTSFKDFDDLPEAVAQALVKHFCALRAEVWTLDAASGLLLRTASAGTHLAHLPESIPLESTAVAAQVARSATAWIRASPPQPDDGLVGDIPKETACAAVLPLHFGTQLHGVMVYLSAQPLTAQRGQLLDLFASMAASLLDHARSHRRTQAARDDAVAARKRAQVLAQAGAALVTSLGTSATPLPAIASLIVAEFDLCCVIDVLTADGKLQRRAAAHVDPERAAVLSEAVPQWGPDAPPTLIVRTLRAGARGQTAALASDEPWPLNADAEVLGRLGLATALSAPMVARGAVLGTVTLGGESPRDWDEDDRRLLAELARLCALTIDNTALVEESAIANASLTRSLALFDALFAAAPLGFALLDTDLRYLRVNNALAQLNQLDAAQYPGRRPSELYPEGVQAEARLRSVLVSGAPILGLQLRHTVPTANEGASERSLLVSDYPITDPFGQVLGVASVVIDVSDRERIERRLREQYDFTRAITANLAEAVYATDHEGVLTFINPAATQLLGWSEGDLLGGDAHRLLHAEGNCDPGTASHPGRCHLLASALTGSVTHSDTEIFVLRDGRRLPIECTCAPIRSGDHVTGSVVAFRDVGQRNRADAERRHLLAMEREARAQAECAQRRLALLAEATAILASSLDHERAVRDVVELVVAHFGGTCSVEVEGADARRAGGATGVPPRATEGSDPRATQPQPQSDALAGTLSLLAAQAAASKRLSTHASAEGLVHHAAAPMITRGRVVGAMVIATPEPLGPEDVAVLEELARRTAVAIDNAQLHEEHSFIARTLQASLLPPVLPEVPGIELAASYRAAGSGNEVGGDFYDVFETSSGWALVMGDVCGNGPEAAALTGLARYTIRASAIGTTRPSHILERLNSAILHQRNDGRFCTATYLALTATRSRGVRVRTCLAGHPHALVVRGNGTIGWLGRAGTLLGLFPHVELHDHVVELQAGDVVVLYTDGVTEARNPAGELFGPERLAEVAAACARSALKDVVSRIEDAIVAFQSGPPRDDLALLVMRVRDPATSPTNSPTTEHSG